MAVRLNHTIVPCRDKQASAAFFTGIFGLDPPQAFGRFAAVQMSNEITLDYGEAEQVPRMHYAFLVDDEDFDPIFERVRDAGLQHYADPGHLRAGEINTREGGRGFYFSDPDGHNLEVLTRTHRG